MQRREIDEMASTSDEPIIAVAVSKSRNGMYPLKWAVENLITPGSSLLLIYVYHPSKCIPEFQCQPGPSIPDVVGGIPLDKASSDVVAQMKQLWEIELGYVHMKRYLTYCKDRKLKTTFSLLERDSIGEALVDHIAHLGISKIVIGNGTRQSTISGPAKYVERHAPGFCEVLTICKDGIALRGRGEKHSTCAESETISGTVMRDASESLPGKINSVHPSLDNSEINVIKKGRIKPNASHTETLERQLDAAVRGIQEQLKNILNARKMIEEYNAQIRDEDYQKEEAWKELELAKKKSREDEKKQEEMAEIIKDTKMRMTEIRALLYHKTIMYGEGVSALRESRKDTEVARKQVARLSDELKKTKKSLENEIQLRKDSENKAIQEILLKQEDIDTKNELLETETELRKCAEEKFFRDLESKREELEKAKKALLEYISKQEEMENTIKALEENIELFKDAEEKALRELVSKQEELEKTKFALETETELRRAAEERATREIRSKQEELDNTKMDLETKIQLCEDAEGKALQDLASKEEELEKTKMDLEMEIRRQIDEKYKALQDLVSKEKELDNIKEKLEVETKQRHDAEYKASKELLSKQEILSALEAQKVCTIYSFQEIEAATNIFSEELKLGEGTSSFVYKGTLRCTAVAIKFLKQNGLQGSQEFQHQVELLSCIHHPHVVLMLGACPEKACIVYEYMANGSLQDYFLKGRTGSNPLPWYIRFRVCYEVASALMFLHSSQPESILHTDLKLGNIFLDHNFVCKISDVGMARIIPRSSAFCVTDDPFFSFQSDLYAFGIVILEVLTGMPPDGIADIVEGALQKEGISSVLDMSAGDWPIQEATELALMGLQCTLPEPEHRTALSTLLNILKSIQSIAESAASDEAFKKSHSSASETIVPTLYMCPISQEVMENPHVAADGFTYEYSCIKFWLENHETSPMTNMQMEHKNLIPNHSLRSAIRDWESKAGTSS